MRLLGNKHESSSEDEESDEEMIEDESTEESEESDDEEPVKSEHPFTADSQSNDEDTEEDDGDHPYPTPPPDADVTISLGNGVKKIIIKDSKPKMVKETKINMAGPKKTKPTVETKKETAPAPTTVKALSSPSGSLEPLELNVAKKGTILANSLVAIRALNSRSGSSVPAIIKYMKSTGYEVTDTRRMSKSVQKALKIAVAKGEVEQVRRSFKLSPAAKLASKAEQNMKAKKQKKLAKQKEPKTATKTEGMAQEKIEKAKAPPAAQEKAEKPMQRKKKASERQTNEPPKKKANAKVAGAAGKAKAAQAALEEESNKPKPKAKPAKNAVVSPDVTPTSEVTSATAKSKVPRKSIGTLAQTTARPKLQTKSIKKLVSGKRNVDEVDSGLMDSAPNDASTPVAPVKQKRTGRQIK
ncbi:uncharacterized protein LOC135436909 [Drosophila montana]|uniref:uncharacterized protein LOC135436909 n=1 Tax=Drosophila montana TaxID=40370 RepID=UPI00313CB5A4